tara:strand:- start:488 stop:985 length:498 start_codon:yes stop_codon:yes gene_type:complete
MTRSSSEDIFLPLTPSLTRAPFRRGFKHPREHDNQNRSGRPDVPSEHVHSFSLVIVIIIVSTTTAAVLSVLIIIIIIIIKRFSTSSSGVIRRWRRSALHVMFFSRAGLQEWYWCSGNPPPRFLSLSCKNKTCFQLGFKQHVLGQKKKKFFKTFALFSLVIKTEFF